MLSYQHGYHAGNFADVHKHTALCLLMRHFDGESKLCTFIDTHAGRGRYDLNSAQAQKTGEWQEGVARLLNADLTSPALRAYLDTLQAFPEKSYPGSPALMAQLMAANHRALLFELHPGEFEELQNNMGEDNRLRLLHQSVMDSLMDYLPARKSPGLMLVDPSYEVKEEYVEIARLVNQAQRRWPTGIKMVWYPILPQGRHQDLKDTLKGATCFELVGPARERGMYGTGLALINAPEDFKVPFDNAAHEMERILFPS